MTNFSTFSEEFFYAAVSQPQGNFRSQAMQLLEQYQKAMAGTTPVWLRFHLSDISNQAEELSALVASCGGIISMTGQPPVNGAKLALEAYHLAGNIQSSQTDSLLELRLKNYKFLYFRLNELSGSGSEEQMFEEFTRAEEILRSYGGTVAENLQRTWIYCRDIDNNYAGLVKARRELFHQYGLNEHTHYIASTGIEGASARCGRLVKMDSMALFGHETAQIEYMQALDHLSPTHVYGVTFERGTRIIFGDRSHYYISGTASIDKEGKILHVGNVARQAERMIENVEALLVNHGATLADLKQAVVYLRDPSDREVVEEILAARLSPETARIMVRGTVCRPGWLVELDGIAVNRKGNPLYKDFA